MQLSKLRNCKLLICGLVILLAAYAMGKKGFFLSKDISMAKGLYRVVPFDGTLNRGELIIVKVPEAMGPYIYGRGWAPLDMPLFKTVGAIAGDTYQITDEDIYVNEHYFGPIFSEDHQKLPMPQLRGSFKVENGYFLPLSNCIPNSFDGRYFGQVPLSFIKYKVLPILVF